MALLSRGQCTGFLRQRFVALGGEWGNLIQSSYLMIRWNTSSLVLQNDSKIFLAKEIKSYFEKS